MENALYTVSTSSFSAGEDKLQSKFWKGGIRKRMSAWVS